MFDYELLALQYKPLFKHFKLCSSIKSLPLSPFLLCLFLTNSCVQFFTPSFMIRGFLWNDSYYCCWSSLSRQHVQGKPDVLALDLHCSSKNTVPEPLENVSSGGDCSTVLLFLPEHK